MCDPSFIDPTIGIIKQRKGGDYSKISLLWPQNIC